METQKINQIIPAQFAELNELNDIYDGFEFYEYIILNEASSKIGIAYENIANGTIDKHQSSLLSFYLNDFEKDIDKKYLNTLIQKIVKKKHDNSLKNKKTISPTKCIIVSEDDLGRCKNFSEQFSQLSGFYNSEFGFVLPLEKKDEVVKICKEINLDYRIDFLPYNTDNFQEASQINVIENLKKRLSNITIELLKLTSKLNIPYLDINDLVPKIDLYKEHHSLLAEKLKLYKNIKLKIEREEFNLTQNKKNSSFKIKFLNELEKNFLLEIAPEMPRLININIKGVSKPFIRKGIVGQIVGAGGIGKTHVLSQLALSVCSGKDFLNYYRVEKTGNVFLVLGENSDDDIHRILKKIADWFLTPEQKILVSKRLAVKSVCGIDAAFLKEDLPSEFYSNLLQELKDTEPIDGWDLIIFDPISRFLGAEAEVDNAAATKFISLLERFTLELKGKPTVLFGHHMNKGSVGATGTDQNASRGSSGLVDGVRWQANLEKIKKENSQEYEENKTKFKVVKSNHTPIYDGITLIKNELGCLSIEENNAPKNNEEEKEEKINALQKMLLSK